MVELKFPFGMYRDVQQRRTRRPKTFALKVCLSRDPSMNLPSVWLRVPSNIPVVFSVAQFPDSQHGRTEDDQEGLLKLAPVSCACCLNPYHVALDCPWPRNPRAQENENLQDGS